MTKGTAGHPCESQHGLGGTHRAPHRDQERSLAVPRTKPLNQGSRDDYLTVRTLKERGWTDAFIREYLGTPDSSCPNPCYGSAAPMRLYARARVEAVEASPAWPTVQKRVARRKAAAAKAVETKTQRLRDSLDERDITVPVMSLPLLTEQACTDDHDQQSVCERGDAPAATPASNASFLERISVNYLRHRLSSYEQELARLLGKVGVREAYLEVNDMVYNAIATAYPTLASECARQRQTKHDHESMREFLRQR
jgi:hypothetical protein